MCNPGYNGNGTSCRGMLNSTLLADMLFLCRTNGGGGGGGGVEMGGGSMRSF